MCPSLPVDSVNHRSLRDPTTICRGWLPAVGIVSSWIGMFWFHALPILDVWYSTNQKPPSGPKTMPRGDDEDVGIDSSAGSVAVSPMLAKAILLIPGSVIATTPYAEIAMPSGEAPAVLTGDSVIVPSGVILA